MARDLYMTATGCTNIVSVQANDSMTSMTTTFDITCATTTLAIGDSVTLDLGFTDEHDVFVTNGVVKKIIYKRPENHYVVTVHDILVKAVDYFIASDTPDTAYQASNITAEDLVVYLLGLAGITGVTSGSTGFVFGVVDPVPINLVSVGDYVEQINRITGWMTYADKDGLVYFAQRKPYIVGGDAPAYVFSTGSTGDISKISYEKSDDKLRNKVIVYGKPGVSAVSSGSSPYLPAGYYKTIVASHELIDRNLEAQAAADLNLTMFNRLTETITLTVIGKPTIRARSIVAVSESWSGLTSSDYWIVFASKHSFGKDGYSMELTLVR